MNPETDGQPRVRPLHHCIITASLHHSNIFSYLCFYLSTRTSGERVSRILTGGGERQPLVATFCNVHGLGEPRELIILNVNASIVGAF